MCNTRSLPATGPLQFTVLKFNFSVSCIIKLPEVSSSEFVKVIIALLGNQVKSKKMRFPTMIAKNNGPVLYRNGLEDNIISYINSSPIIAPAVPDNVPTKGLLLNDRALDKLTGDTEIVPSIRFERSDKTSLHFLAPGASYKNLVELIGVGFISLPMPIEEFISYIIDTMVSHFMLEIVPEIRITSTRSLEDDIRRYLEMVIYGN